MGYLLDEAVASERTGDGVHLVRLTADWNTANRTPNGGYVLALLQHAVLQESAHPDALSISITYFRPGLPGPGEIRVREVRKGRRISTYDAVLVQEGKEIAHAVVSTHDWDATGRLHPHPARRAAGARTGGLRGRQRARAGGDGADPGPLRLPCAAGTGVVDRRAERHHRVAVLDPRRGRATGRRPAGRRDGRRLPAGHRGDRPPRVGDDPG
ncbi:hypothetical protein G5V59_08650 [Nocardioides sp. W3-2-3]|uniref:acyl-CoA thioesterase domain-containing protein n=1 Tax=Nocardioides convexus TaxID=2712224 RepID=UPI00241839E9|nr:acyl-CoA thioesterase domain-containing protein [Nocardioides convexus]NHA00183.1 hypothetical protein [Nocardioides convexus]